MSSRTVVVVVRKIDELTVHIDGWRRLSANALESNVFYEPAMLIPALRHLVEPERWQVVLIYRERQLIALFPLCRRQVGGVTSSIVLELLRYRHSYLHTPLVDRQQAEVAMAAWLEWLHARSGTSVLRASRVTIEGPVFGLMRRELQLLGGNWATTRHFLRPLLDPSGDADEYLAGTLSRERLRQLHRRRRGLEKQGRVSFHVLEPADDIRPWLSAFLALEAAGWKGEAGTALAQTPAHVRFFREAASDLHRNGQVLFYGLRQADRWIALACDFRAAEPGGGAFCFKQAYDENLGKFAPGVQLEVEIVRLFHDAVRHSGWVDSCTSPRNEVIGGLWRGRRAIGDVAMTPASWRGSVGGLVLQARSVAIVARNLKHSQIWRQFLGASGALIRGAPSFSGLGAKARRARLWRHVAERGAQRLAQEVGSSAKQPTTRLALRSS